MCGSTKVNSEYAHLHSTYLCRRTYYDRGALSVDGYIAMQMVTTLHTHGAYACDLRGQPNAPTRTRFCHTVDAGRYECVLYCARWAYQPVCM